MRKDAHAIDLFGCKAKHILFLAVLCLLAICQNKTEARAPEGISVSSAGISPAPAVVGQEAVFSASYAASPETGAYRLHACKTKKILSSGGGSCQGGSWCDSPSYAADNPMTCAFAPAAAGKDYPYYIFVCDDAGRCSNPFSGVFSAEDRALSLQAPAALDFGFLPFSFSSQESARAALGDLVLTAKNADGIGWSLDAAVRDWTSADGRSFDADGDGDATGRLTVDLDSLSIESFNPLAAAGITPGITASFSPSVGIINIASSRNGGSGIFVLKGIGFRQFIPANQEEGDYKTVVTFTVS